MDKPLLFLIKLAWACRYRLPLLITIGFMALDIRMQLEIHVQMRRIRRIGPPPPPSLMRPDNSNFNPNRNRNDSNGGESTDSWLTMDESEGDEERSTLRSSDELQPSTSTQMTTNMAYLNFPDPFFEQDTLLDVTLEN